MPPEGFCEVAVALPVPGSFQYKIPESLVDAVRVGHRVLVPFGKRRVTGYVVSLQDDCRLDLVKPLLDLLDPEPVFDEVRLSLFRFISDYYLQPLGEVNKAALPAGINRQSRTVWSILEAGIKAAAEPGLPVADRRVLMCMEQGATYTSNALASRCDAATYGVLERLSKKGWVLKDETLEEAATRAKYVTVYRVSSKADGTQTLQALARAPKQESVFRFLLDSGEADMHTLRAAVPGPESALAALQRRGLVTAEKVECYRFTESRFSESAKEALDLNAHQRDAVELIASSLEKGEYAAFLLHGVTGSGKTEVYIRLAQFALERERSVLVLVPEIALTPQLLSRFVRRFGARVAISHSGLPEAERYDQWRRMLRGEVRLCVGTRSALFSPLRDLGLIVVDEEHDAGYKQDEGVCYNARDLALVLGRSVRASVVLGSATPSMESYQSAMNGKYRILRLPERATVGRLPDVEVVDLVEAISDSRKRKPVRSGEEPLKPPGKSIPTARYAISPKLEKAIEETLERQEQGILFLNRRGFSTHAFCLECRRTVMCPNCAVSLTSHKSGRELRCHYCDYHRPAETVCDFCGGMNLFFAGVGTEQVEAMLAQRFPNARVSRLDRDTTTRKGDLEKTLSDFAAGRHDLLVGTQMVAKGHDFPNVTLVGVLSADAGMNLPDFRASERTFQLLSQVAGRAGRGDRPGRVIVQTFNPTHYAVTTACRHDFQCFFEEELKRRTDPSYPPFARLALMRARSKTQSSARSLLLMIANSLRQSIREQQAQGVRVLGPSPSALSRIKNLYRFQMLLMAPTPSILLAFARQAASLAGEWGHGDVEWRIDIDPQNVL